MLYITQPEIVQLAPETTIAGELEGNEQAYINRGCSFLDGYLNRGKYGLGIRPIMNAQISLTGAFNGVLPIDRFVGWIGTTGRLTYQSTNQDLRDIDLAEFFVDRRAGTISAAAGRLPRNFFRSDPVVPSPYSQVMSQYHGSNPMVIENNEYPYILEASFRAGLYVIRPITGISVSGSVGLDNLTITSVDYLSVGDEFYFSTDPEGESDVDFRLITEIDTEAKKVTFDPPLGYAIPGTAKFRRIDRCVRVAVASIIACLLTYPPDTDYFSEGLGRSALVNSWRRSDGGDIMRSISHLMRV